jgi:hypothetical protein
MCTMSTKTPLKRLYVRANPESRHALKTLLAAVQSPSLLPDVNQEELVAASWLWMAGMAPEAVASGVRPFVEAIRASLSREEEHETQVPKPGFAPAATKVIRSPKRSEKSAG